MKRPASTFALLLAAAASSLAVGSVACSRSQDTAAEGTVPVLNRPAVGPVPGIGDAQPVVNPLSGDADAVVHGRRLFVQYNCAGCHGGRAGGGMGPSLRDPVWLYGKTPGHIFNSIAEGRAHGMPAWGARIPDKQVWELVAYIQSLRQPNEPDKPE